MSRVYTFANAGKDTVLDDLVSSFGRLVDARRSANFQKTEEYLEDNRLFSEAITKYCFENSGLGYEGLDMLKNPMYTGRTSFKETFDTVIAQVITPVMPKVTSDKYMDLADVVQVGFGDNGLYQVESNEMFIINEAAEGIARGGIQTLYNTEYSVRATKKTVTVGVDWYQVVSNVHDWGLWGMKIAKSYEAYITAAIIRALTTIVSTADGRKSIGISGYFANGFSDTNWMALRRNVSLANGGAPVYALGTSIGLSDVLPSATAGFRFGWDDPNVVHGYLPMYKDVGLVEIDNALYPNTINTTPQTIVPDNMIFMIAMGSYKPVKLLFEGNTVTVEHDALRRADNVYDLTIDMRIGVDVIAGSKFGVLIKGN